MMTLQLDWRLSNFKSLSTSELYAILRLRSEVFVVEQSSVFLDLDNRDQESMHLTAWDHEELVAYARLIPPGNVYEEMSIGRVVSSPAYRKKGAGKQLLEKSIEQCFELFGKGPIKIGAQLYLQKFYESFGFIQTGAVYDEDGIPHIKMIRA